MTRPNDTLSTATAADSPKIDKDSIYFSKERYRLISQRLGPLSIQHLVIDTYENEIVGTHKLMSDAMAQRDALDPVAAGDAEVNHGC